MAREIVVMAALMAAVTRGWAEDGGQGCRGFTKIRW